MVLLLLLLADVWSFQRKIVVAVSFDHQKRDNIREKKTFHSFYASSFALSLWLPLFCCCSLCRVLDVRAYVCAVQISNVCIHYNIILCVFSALFRITSVLCPWCGRFLRCLWFFFFHSFGRCRRLHLRTFWSATKTNSNGFQQTLIQMQHLNFSFQNVHCSMSSKTHSKRWRISDVICELGLAAASFFSAVVDRPFYTHMHFCWFVCQCH